MKLQDRQKFLGLIAATALTVLLGDRLVVEPLIKSWKQRSEHIADLRKRTSQGLMLLDREQVLRQRWAEMQTNALSPQIAESQLVKAFDRWTQESGVSVSSIRPQSRQSADDYLTIDCRADAFGNLSNLTHFLYLIERDALGVKVDSAQFTTRDKQADQLTLTLQVSGVLIQPPGS